MTSSARFRSFHGTTSEFRRLPSFATVADVLPAIERVGGAPVVIKLLEGTQGIGVILAPDTKVAEAVIETLQSTKQNVLIQRFIAESGGRDIRALVVGDRVVAAMRRRAQEGEFRSNVHRGGSTEIIELDKEFERVAVQSAEIMGLRVAGVDMLESDGGPLVLEVNSSPGLEGIETATGLDVAGAIVDYILSQVAFPELDVRQRLTVSTGYGVAELQVHESADLVGRAIDESGLRSRDITVLSLTRGTTVIPIRALTGCSRPTTDCCASASWKRCGTSSPNAGGVGPGRRSSPCPRSPFPTPRAIRRRTGPELRCHRVVAHLN